MVEKGQFEWGYQKRRTNAIYISQCTIRQVYSSGLSNTFLDDVSSVRSFYQAATLYFFTEHISEIHHLSVTTSNGALNREQKVHVLVLIALQISEGSVLQPWNESSTNRIGVVYYEVMDFKISIAYKQDWTEFMSTSII